MRAPLPLAGMRVATAAGAPAISIASRLLETLGAVAAPAPDAHLVLAEQGREHSNPGGPANRPVPRAVLIPDQLLVELVGVPDGTVDYATGLALAAAGLAAVIGAREIGVSAIDVALQLFLPEVMAAAYESPHWPAPRQPVIAPGGGYLSCELGTPADQESFSLLSATLPRDAEASTVAVAAQEWRLPVCDYRLRPAAVPTPPIRVLPHVDGAISGRARHVRRCTSAGPPDDRAPLEGTIVVDLTAMWAGPLCTWLLARLGAAVVKIEPAIRPDGLRALDGGGVHPAGRSTAPGSDSALFNALNNTKRAEALDLREDTARARLIDLVAASDVVVDSFSPRVMANLGLTRPVLAESEPRRITLSLPAFPPGPERDWVAYGTGVHAVSGLGDTGVGFSAPSVTYPDAIGGLTGAVAVLAGLVGRHLGWLPSHLEVSLLSAVSPLLDLGVDRSRVAARSNGSGSTLLSAAQLDPRALVSLDVSGRSLPHPTGPFRGVEVPVTAPPAPPAPSGP